MQINPYLFYDGNCEAAFKFYEKALGGKINGLMTDEGAPQSMPTPPGGTRRSCTPRCPSTAQALMASDAPPGISTSRRDFRSRCTIKDPAEAERKFKALAEGGSVNMPFGKTFFSKGFGMCVDQFGIPWMVNRRAKA